MKEWIIPAKGEFRFEVDFNQTVSFKLTSGTAEVFGAELAPGREYSFSGQKLAIFSYDGATITLAKPGECIVEYIASDAVPVPLYLSLLLDIQKTNNPRVLLLGSGRNTLARTLCNYSFRLNRAMLYVSIDVRTNSLFFPGTLSAHSVHGIVEAEDVSMAGGVATENAAAPLSLFFGSMAIADNKKLWMRLVQQLAKHVTSRLNDNTNPHPQPSSCVVVGPSDQDLESWSSDDAIIEDLQRSFQLDWIVVVGNERLHARLQRLFSRTLPTVRIVKLPTSGGLVSHPRPGDWDRRVTHRLFNHYFYGPKQELNPFSQVIADFSLFRILLGEEDVMAPMSALPVGATRRLDECRAVKAEPSSSLLLFSIIAILYTEPTVQGKEAALSDAFINGNVAGYLYVTAVDEQRKTITVLSPCPGQPPSRIFLCGRLKWIE